MTKTVNLSVVINTKNSAEFLANCLDSVKNIADEIVVVDSASTDNTVAIAKKFGAKIHQFPQPEIGFVEAAREYLFERANGQWLLLLDSDESIGQELAKKITAIINNKTSDPAPADVYFIARQNIIFGRPFTATGWYPDYQARLWKKGSLNWPAKIHSVPNIHGTSAHLAIDEKLAIIHHNYQSVSEYLDRSNRYTDIQAERDFDATKVDGYSASAFINCFFDEWLRRFFALRGHQDGNHGALLSLLQANYQVTTLAKQWQKANFPHHSLGQEEFSQTLKQLQRHLKYWQANFKVKNSTGLKKLYYRLQRKLAS